MLSFVHLKTFITVCRLGSFTKAAHELNLTQPAVSGHIASLEDEVGMKLFNRTGKKIVLTDAGEVVLKSARSILAKVENMRSELEDLRAFRGGTIRIGASKIIGVYMMPRILMAFRDQFPDIEMQISIHSAHTIAEQVEENAYDLAIVGEGDPIVSPNIGIKKIGEDRLTIVAAPNHPLAAKKGLTLAEAARESFILSGRQTASLQSLHAYLKKQGITLKSSIEMDEAGAIKRAVESGAGLAVLSRAVVEREIEEGRLVEIKFEGSERFRRGILMLWRQDRRFSQNTEAFMRFLQKNFADTLEGGRK